MHVDIIQSNKKKHFFKGHFWRNVPWKNVENGISKFLDIKIF